MQDTFKVWSIRKCNHLVQSIYIYTGARQQFVDNFWVAMTARTEQSSVAILRKEEVIQSISNRTSTI